MGTIGQAWGIGKKRFGENWKWKIELFDWLVGSVVGFGTEIWRWKRWEGYKEDIRGRYLELTESYRSI